MSPHFFRNLGYFLNFPEPFITFLIHPRCYRCCLKPRRIPCPTFRKCHLKRFWGCWYGFVSWVEKNISLFIESGPKLCDSKSWRFINVPYQNRSDDFPLFYKVWAAPQTIHNTFDVPLLYKGWRNPWQRLGKTRRKQSLHDHFWS